MTIESVPVGRRERKKAETRRRIAESARRLFLTHGYDEVGIRDVAADADVAVTTLFSHFASKEALVFELDDVFEQRFVRAVTDRRPDEMVLQALRRELEVMLRHCGSDAARPIWSMIDESATLHSYEESMLTRHAASLADALKADPELGLTPTAAQTMSRFIVSVYSVARATSQPLNTLDEIFPMIEASWHATAATRVPPLSQFTQ